MEATPSHPDEHPCTDLAAPPDEAVPEPAIGSTLSDSPAASASERQRGVLLSQMGRGQSIPDTNRPDTSAHGAHEAVCGPVGGEHNGSCQYNQIPQLEALRSEDDTVAPADLPAVRRTPDVVGGTGGLQDLVPTRGIVERAHPLPKPSSPAAEEHAWEGQRQEYREGQTHQVNPAATWERLVLMDALSRLTLSNTGNQCFVNAAVMATLWAILSRVDFQFSDLGPEATLIASSIMSFSLGPLTLADQTWFQDVLHSWPNPTNQGDPVEFLSHVLRGMHFGGFNMKWERRMQINEIIRVMDHNDALRPITVQFDELDPDAIQHGYTALQTMINSWESQYGMQTALTDPTALVCIHVDRFVHQGKSSVTKSERPIHFRGSLTLPVFDNTGLTISRRGYQLLSAIAHLGADEEGHCRAILKRGLRPPQTRSIFWSLMMDSRRRGSGKNRCGSSRM